MKNKIIGHTLVFLAIVILLWLGLQGTKFILLLNLGPLLVYLALSSMAVISLLILSYVVERIDEKYHIL